VPAIEQDHVAGRVVRDRGVEARRRRRRELEFGPVDAVEHPRVADLDGVTEPGRWLEHAAEQHRSLARRVERERVTAPRRRPRGGFQPAPAADIVRPRIVAETLLAVGLANVAPEEQQAVRPLDQPGAVARQRRQLVQRPVAHLADTDRGAAVARQAGTEIALLTRVDVDETVATGLVGQAVGLTAVARRCVAVVAGFAKIDHPRRRSGAPGRSPGNHRRRWRCRHRTAPRDRARCCRRSHPRGNHERSRRRPPRCRRHTAHRHRSGGCHIATPDTPGRHRSDQETTQARCMRHRGRGRRGTRRAGPGSRSRSPRTRCQPGIACRRHTRRGPR
jgi:hypothetical protein